MSPLTFMAIVLFLTFAITLVIVLTDETMTSEQQSNSMAFTTFLAIVGILFLVIDREPTKKKSWNELTFDEQCKILAQDIKEGRQKWFLNPSIGEQDTYVVAILPPKNMNEMGCGKHIETTKKDICRLIFAGKIKNPEMVNGVLTYLK